MTPQDPFRRAGWYVWAIVAVLLVVWPVACHFTQAQALAPDLGQVPGDPAAAYFDCEALVAAVAPFADFRDTGSDIELVIGMLRTRTRGAPQSRIDIAAREIRRLWAEGLPRQEAAFQLFRRCQRQLGDMGRDS